MFASQLSKPINQKIRREQQEVGSKKFIRLKKKSTFLIGL